LIACVLVAAALLAFTYVGYPVAIGVLARVFPWTSQRSSAGPAPMVTVCLPVYNGAAYLPAKLESLFAQDYPADRIEIIVYCDGCSDASARVAEEIAGGAAAANRVRVISIPERRGKPAALNRIASEARGDLLLMNDVRQPFSPNAVSALCAAMSDPVVGCATGNLVLQGGAPSGVYWRYENWIRRQESRFRGVVGMSGSIAMMRRSDWSPLPEPLILDDVWIPMKLGLHGRRVVFVEQAEARDAAFEDEHEFRRKVRTLAGNYQLFAWMPALLSPFANRQWFETIAHKLLRLVAPWLMILLAICSAAAALAGARWIWPLVAAQAVFYGAALVGRRAGRLAGVARTFVVLNAAALLGLARYLTGRQRVTW
jgi:cellulose synthase/poly-beta-1,6-N-acetylglucosamine synthase-like glycosyltransferase